MLVVRHNYATIKKKVLPGLNEILEKQFEKVKRKKEESSPCLRQWVVHLLTIVSADVLRREAESEGKTR